MPSRSSGLRAKVAGAFADDARDDVGPSTGLFESESQGGQLRRIPIDLVAPREDQPRQSMDPGALEELAASIRDRGVLQPIRVRAKPTGGYEIIAGERRWRAAGQAGLRDIPAVIAESTDDEAYLDALIENIQREDLNPVDRAQALKRLRVNLGAQSWEEVGRVIGISRRHVYHLLNITELPAPIQQDIRAGDLTEKHGRALLQLQAHPQQQAALWERIQAEGLTGDAAIAVGKELRPVAIPPTRRPRTIPVEPLIRQLLDALPQAEPLELARIRHQLDELRQRVVEAIASAAVAAAINGE